LRGDLDDTVRVPGVLSALRKALRRDPESASRLPRKRRPEPATIPTKEKQTMKRKPLALLAAAALSFAATAASAGECPADKRVPDGQGQKKSESGPKDVTDTVIASTDLGNEKPGLKDYQFRARKLVIKAGGIVPWHSHDERPAMIYIAKGSITEYASNCAVPIVHTVGALAREAKGTSHWWQNTGKETVEIISVDILPPQMKHDKLM
jgi:quercetin dioxygenase-like cupin family protein